MSQFWKSIFLTALVVIPSAYANKVFLYLQSIAEKELLILISVALFLLVIGFVIFIPTIGARQQTDKTSRH